MDKSADVWLSGIWLVLLASGAICASWMLPDPRAIDLGHVIYAPAMIHPAGTDELGRDVLSRLLHAARSTLLITTGATLLDVLFASVLGLLAGYYGGWLDRALGVLIDLFWTVPFVVFVILVVSLVGVSVVTLILSIAAINWVTAARIIRAEAVRVRQQPFVRAAEAFGFAPAQVVIQQIVPAIGRTLLSLMAYTAVEVLTLETGLAFIGLSLPAPTPTWGGMLSDGLTYLSSAWWLVLLPAGAITLTLVSLQSMGRALEHDRQHQAEG